LREKCPWDFIVLKVPGLPGWNKEKKKVRYHNNTVNECIYYNYTKPSVLQTYEYLGNDCWDRQRIKRKIKRLFNKLMDLPEIERNAILQVMGNLDRVNYYYTKPGK
jgi:hypothetical protein